MNERARESTLNLDAADLFEKAQRETTDEKTVVNQLYERLCLRILACGGKTEADFWTGRRENYRGRGDYIDLTYEYKEFFCSWRNFPVTIVVSRSAERVSLTQTIDFSRNVVNAESLLKISPDPKSDPKWWGNLVQQAKTLLPIISERKFSTIDQPRCDDMEENSLKTIANGLFDQVWVEQEADLKLSTVVGELESIEGKSAFLFADFRGVVLPHIVEELTSPYLIHPFQTTPDQVVFASDDDVTETKEDSSQNAVSRYWEFIKASEMNFASREVIACTIFDRRAIYISTLGHGVVPEDYSTGPVKFFLITKTRNRRQIGRLVDRINNLGSLRLLALRNLRLFEKASLDVQALGKTLDRLDFSQAEPSRQDEIVQAFVAKLQSIGQGAHGGLPFRINQSRSYVRSFKELISNLEMGHIEGFQSYEDFVQRRLYSQFDLIDGVGTRIAQLRDRFLSLTEASQTKALYIAQKERNQLLKVGQVIELLAVAKYGGEILEAGAKSLGHSPVEQWLSLNPIVYNGLALAVWLLLVRPVVERRMRQRIARSADRQAEA